MYYFLVVYIPDKVRFLFNSGTLPGLPYCALTNTEAYQWVWNHTDMVFLWIFKAWKPIFLNNINEYSSFPACNVKWLGLRGDDLQLIPQSAFQELKPRDLQIAKSLLSSKFFQVRMLYSSTSRVCSVSKKRIIQIEHSHTNLHSIRLHRQCVIKWFHLATDKIMKFSASCKATWYHVGSDQNWLS